MVIQHFTGQFTKVCSFSWNTNYNEIKYSILVHDSYKIFLNLVNKN